MNDSSTVPSVLAAHVEDARSARRPRSCRSTSDAAARSPILHDVHARRHATMPRILRDTRVSASPPSRDEPQHPRPLVVGQAGVRPRRPHLGEQLVRLEAAAQRDGHEVLRQHVERALDRQAAPRSRRARHPSRAAATSISSSAFVGTHVTRLTAPGRCPLRPARCSSRATPFGLPTWSTRSTGEKSTPRSSDDVATTQRSAPVAQPCFDPIAPRAIERSVVQRDHARPVGTRGEQRLVPDLRLRAGVGEHQRASPFLDRARPPAAASACRGGRPREIAR